MIRDEAKQTLWRLREVLIALALASLGAYWAHAFFGLLQYIGYALLGFSVIILIMGLQRFRFRTKTTGAGVVTVIEGQITYFGPYSGGTIATQDISRISLVPKPAAKCWVLEQPAQPAITIPVDARGTDGLFDAFASLPGLRIEHMLSMLSREITKPTLIWQQNTYLDPDRFLH